jgi:glucosamine--fructose-6-phosphate aminotransferase (isomerizing)
MCGIIGYLGHDDCKKYILEGLKILQNRGYDSAGISMIKDKQFETRKFASNNVNDALHILEKEMSNFDNVFCNGIGHTRWATHGSKTDYNAHPHQDNLSRISIVHNGIIENYNHLKDNLIKQNYTFHSQTDTEVISVLIGSFLDNGENIKDSIQKTVQLLKGTWALCIIHVDFPDKMWICRNGSPLLLGIEDNYAIIASESSGFGNYIQKYIVLENNDLLEITLQNNKITYTENIHQYKMKNNEFDGFDSLPDGCSHWMKKEIFEQIETINRSINYGGRIENKTCVKLGGLDDNKDNLLDIKHLIILGCGTSYHAGLWSLYEFKSYEIFDTVSCIDGAEFDVSDIPRRNKTALILCSQSGETKDLHRCIDIARTFDLITIGVVNTADSMIARETDCGVYLNAGREVAVASTKSFTSQCIILTLIAIWFAQNKGIHIKKRQKAIHDLRNFSFQLNSHFDSLENLATNCAKILKNSDSLFILGKGNNEAIAKEGSLKIKEVAYIHSEGYSSSALKHGPFALIKENLPIIIIDTVKKYNEKSINAFNEVKSRKANVFIITDNISSYANIDIAKENIIEIPNNETYGSLIANIYLQLLSYHLSTELGYNPDFPRNLAKVVTVE